MSERPAVFRQIYLASAVLAFAASFAPLWVPQPVDTGSDLGTYSLWTVIPADGGGAALLGVVLVLALVGLAVAAAAVPTLGRGVPVTLAVMAVVAVLMLLAKPGTGDPRPAFGAGAGLLFGTSLFLAGTAVADIVSSLRSSSAPSAQGSASRTAQ